MQNTRLGFVIRQLLMLSWVQVSCLCASKESRRATKLRLDWNKAHSLVLDALQSTAAECADRRSSMTYTMWWTRLMAEWFNGKLEGWFYEWAVT